MTLAARLDGWWRTPAPATRLAVLRLLVGGFALGLVAVRAPYLARYTSFHDSQFAPVCLATPLDRPLPDVARRTA